MGQSLNALLQTIVHGFLSPGGVGIKFALAIILHAGLVWRATLATIWPGAYASWKGLVMVAGQSCIASLSIFPLHLTRNYPITNVPLRSLAKGGEGISQRETLRRVIVCQERASLGLPYL